MHNATDNVAIRSLQFGKQIHILLIHLKCDSATALRRVGFRCCFLSSFFFRSSLVVVLSLSCFFFLCAGGSGLFVSGLRDLPMVCA